MYRYPLSSRIGGPFFDRPPGGPVNEPQAVENFSPLSPRMSFSGSAGGSSKSLKPDAMKTQTLNAPRRDRLIHEHNHDPYKTKSKLREPAFCPTCKAVFRNGRWQWADSWAVNSNPVICQACNRIRDNYPAGVITLKGGFVMQHKTEILNLVRNHETEEKAEHPLHRIMKVEERPASMIVTTTDIHLPRRIGESLRHSHKGELDIHYDQEGYFIRVNWFRD